MSSTPELSVRLNLDRVTVDENGFGYNAATGGHGDMMAMGIIDSTKVIRFGLQTAASIVSLRLTAGCIIVDAPKHGAPESEDLPRGD